MTWTTWCQVVSRAMPGAEPTTKQQKVEHAPPIVQEQNKTGVPLNARQTQRNVQIFWINLYS